MVFNSLPSSPTHPIPSPSCPLHISNTNSLWIHEHFNLFPTSGCCMCCSLCLESSVPSCCQELSDSSSSRPSVSSSEMSFPISLQCHPPPTYSLSHTSRTSSQPRFLTTRRALRSEHSSLRTQPQHLQLYLKCIGE